MNRGTKKADAGHAKRPFGNSKGIENPISETKSAINSIGRPRLARCRVFLQQPVRTHPGIRQQYGQFLTAAVLDGAEGSG